VFVLSFTYGGLESSFHCFINLNPTVRIELGLQRYVKIYFCQVFLEKK
jgi:hypothetical protein